MYESDFVLSPLVLDVELLIEEVRKRPVLWDRLSTEYNNRVLKYKMWEEVYEAVFADWKSSSSAEKRMRGEEIKKKWRNIKDTYAKELVVQKKALKGKMKRKRPYRFATELSFLNGQFQEREPVSSDSSDDEGDFANKRRRTMTRNSKLCSNLTIDMLVLIREVKSRPILWNKQSQTSERNERENRDKLWAEICEVLFDDWGELRASAQSLHIIEVKKKWRNLRDSYGRELGNQRKVELGILKPKKPYRFFEELSFLYGSLEKRNDDYPVLENQVEIEVPSDTYSLESDSNFEPQPAKKEEIVVKSYDEDVCFSEMLVPMLKRLNDEQKHYAQVKILNVLRRARQFDPLANIEERTKRGVTIVKEEFECT